MVQEAERLQDQAFLRYAIGSFEAATNALMKYAAFLDANELRIASFRDVKAHDLKGRHVPFPLSRDIPAINLSAHSMLACMMIYSGNTNEAIIHLSRAYKAHVQGRLNTSRQPVSRADFVGFILDAREKIDSKAGAAWKARYSLDTNIANGIAAEWRRKNA